MSSKQDVTSALWPSTMIIMVRRLSHLLRMIMVDVRRFSQKFRMFLEERRRKLGKRKGTSDKGYAVGLNIYK